MKSAKNICTSSAIAFVLLFFMLQCRSQTATSSSENIVLANVTYYLQGHETHGLSGTAVVNKLKFNSENIVEYKHHDVIEIMLYEINSSSQMIKIYHREQNQRGRLYMELHYVDAETLHQEINNETRIWKR